MVRSTTSPITPEPTRRIRELVCVYRPLRDHTGCVVGLSTRVLNTPNAIAAALAPLLRHEPVEVFAVACLSTRWRLLAWHVVSRGTRASTLVSMPDVFVPACLTPGTTGLVVLHNHPSGEVVPSIDDLTVTRRLCAAAATLEIDILDHLIVGEGDQYYSFYEAGRLDSLSATRSSAKESHNSRSHYNERGPAKPITGIRSRERPSAKQSGPLARTRPVQHATSFDRDNS